MEKNFNDLTIRAYNEEAETYTLKTPRVYQEYHKPMLNWIDAALAGLNQNARVFEIGSATPRDAKYIREKGFFTQTSDAAEQFVEHLRNQGENALLFNALLDPLPQDYDLLFANAVIPHFTPANLLLFLNKAQSLKPGTRIAFNIKMGSGDHWINEKLHHRRFTHYWQPEELERLLLLLKFNIIFFDRNVAGDLPNHHWVNIVIEKPLNSTLKLTSPYRLKDPLSLPLAHA